MNVICEETMLYMYVCVNFYTVAYTITWITLVSDGLQWHIIVAWYKTSGVCNNNN